ncbi:MAG: FliM/FliN family flagellar motor switch protein [Planctomycetales bacterium]|nr:FliM/FliN family flagellar motor switch protein [Planctomycetales bacterium]
MTSPKLNRDELQFFLSPDARGPADTASARCPPPTVRAEHASGTNDAADDTEWLRQFQAYQIAFGHRASQALSQTLQHTVSIRLTDMRAIEYREFVLELDHNTCLNVLHVQPFQERSCLEIHPSVLFPIMHTMMGGNLSNESIVRRPLTDIELRVANRLVQLLLTSWEESWREVVPVKLTVECVENNAKTVRCLEPSAAVVLCEYEVDLRVKRGPLRIAVPATSVQLMKQRHERQRGLSEGRITGPDELLDHGTHDHAELTVVAAEIEISPTQLANYQVGDILRTETLATAPVQIRIDGETVFLGRPGKYGRSRAVRIDQRVYDESG